MQKTYIFTFFHYRGYIDRGKLFQVFMNPQLSLSANYLISDLSHLYCIRVCLICLYRQNMYMVHIHTCMCVRACADTYILTYLYLFHICIPSVYSTLYPRTFYVEAFRHNSNLYASGVYLSSSRDIVGVIFTHISSIIL